MRILLVEDEPSAATMLAKRLREESYAVDIAADGETAQAQAFINDYDLIILDIVLPGKDGFRVCRELDANGLTVPVLMLTARDAVEDRVEGLDSGADDYLPAVTPQRTDKDVGPTPFITNSKRSLCVASIMQCSKWLSLLCCFQRRPSPRMQSITRNCHASSR